jgi:hypothetical protein
MLANIGFESLSSDLCIFKYYIKQILLIIYVNDMLISALTKVIIASMLKAISDFFELKKLDDVKHFLDINITQDRTNRHVFLS